MCSTKPLTLSSYFKQNNCLINIVSLFLSKICSNVNTYKNVFREKWKRELFQPSCRFGPTNFLLRDDRADRNDSTQSSGNEFGTRGHFRSVRRRLQVREERIPEKFEENQLVDSKKVVAEREKWWIKVK
jgi:hypothetical protein